MKINHLFSIFAAFLLLITSSCRNEEETIPETPKSAYENGFLVANQGNFGVPNASVSFIARDLSSIQNNIFASQNNNANLGDVLQDMAFYGDKVYFVLNNSNKIVIANRKTMKKEGEITTEINQPRHIAFANNYIYVTNDVYNGAKYLSIYNLGDRSFVKKINLTEAAENVVAAGGKIFVQNASFGTGNDITVVETGGNTILNMLALPKGDINKIIADQGFVYAITKDGTDSYLYMIQASDYGAISVTLPGLANATNLNIEGNNLYFSSSNKIYKMAKTATTAPTSPIITVLDNSYSTLYGINVLDGKIFTSDANGFTADSKIAVYSTSGALLKTFEAGKSSVQFGFNP